MDKGHETRGRISLPVPPLTAPPPADTWAPSSARAQNISRILNIASDAFDSRDKAIEWLNDPNIQTGQMPPASLIESPEGFATVETILRQIQYGVFG